MGSGHTLGERGGEQAHTLSIAELPTHTHVLSGANANAAVNSPTNNVLANTTAVYHDATGGLVNLNPGSVTNTGGSQAHLNMQPFLVLSFCIALQGIFPSQT
jgi:microcystin-dependent protein